MYHDSAKTRSRSHRPPLHEASNRANILRGAREQSYVPRSSPPVHKHPMSIQSSEAPNTDDTFRSSPAAAPPTTPPPTAYAAAENKRVSMVVDSQPNSNRNSAISTTSTASGKSKRKTHIGPWQLGRTLGKGATGRVRLAKHALTGQTAAIKIVSKKSAAMAQSQSIAAMDKNMELTSCVPGGRVIPCGIEREVVIMKLIEHPNIINLYDVWENRGELYLVLEYIEGGELFDYVSESGPLPEIEAIRLFRQIIAALSYCHRFNICHRDLKPENILLDTNCNIKLADFGMAALQPAGHWLNTSCGSPHYASPEIIYGHRYHGDKADIWSCGIILFAMLTGYLPFDGGDLPNTLRLVKKGEYIFPPWLNSEAMDLIQRILQKQPRDRISISEMWSHPLLKKYEKHHILMASEGASLGPAPPLSEKDCGRKITRRQDIDMELLRSLQTLWHGARTEELVSRLLSDEVNHEKMFYHALAKFRDDQLENYEGPLGCSASDYHHISRGHSKTQQRIPSSRHASQSWRRSQLSIATGRSTFEETSYPEPKSVRTIASYDPYRSSRTPISNPQVEFANVTIHRQSSGSPKSKRDDSSSQASNSPSHFTLKRQLSRDRRSFIPSSSIGPNRWNRKCSISSFQSRSSIASSRRRVNGFAGSRSTSYKRNVCFRHPRNQRPSGRHTPKQKGVARTHSQYSVSPRMGMKGTLPSDRFSSPTLPTPPPPVRLRKNTNQEADAKIAEHRIPCQYWRDEARKVSTELGKICEEAFNRTSVSSSSPSVETTKQPESPPTSVSAPGEIGSSKERYKMRPLPEPPAESSNSYTIRELADTRRRLIEHSVQATSDDLPQYLSEVIAHLDRLIGDELAPSAEMIVKPCPEPLPQTPESFLPSIAEGDIFDDCTTIIEDIQREPKASESKSSKNSNWKPEKTIRMVPHGSSISEIDMIKPLTIRKKSGASSTHKRNHSVDSFGQYRSASRSTDDGPPASAPLSRRSSNTRYYTGLEPIEENPRSPKGNNDTRNSGESRKWSWFKHKTQSQEQIPPPLPSKDTAPCLAPVNDDNNRELGKRKSIQGLLELGKRKSFQGLLETDEPPKVIEANQPQTKGRKGRFWPFGRRKVQKQKPAHEIAKGINDSNDSTSSVLSVPATVTESEAPRSPLPIKADKPLKRNDTKKAESRRPGGQNWFARFFHIKPASKTLAFQVSKLRARKEVVKILHEWKKYGMEDVHFDKESFIVAGRVAEVNFLRLSPVEFSGEFFTVLEQGRHANLSLLHLRQERGAASSFHRVVDTLEIVLKKRGVLVEDSSRAKKMAKVLDLA